MLNLEDWLRWKGQGIPPEMLTGDENFLEWYTAAMTSPPSLRNLCRKVIQVRLFSWETSAQYSQLHTLERQHENILELTGGRNHTNVKYVQLHSPRFKLNETNIHITYNRPCNSIWLLPSLHHISKLLLVIFYSSHHYH